MLIAFHAAIETKLDVDEVDQLYAWRGRWTLTTTEVRPADTAVGLPGSPFTGSTLPDVTASGLLRPDRCVHNHGLPHPRCSTGGSTSCESVLLASGDTCRYWNVSLGG